MAGGSLLTLLDDIAYLLDDVASMSKVAAKKTAGVLGDDLALNAQQVAGVHADRELPVVWAVAVGSMKNKAILVPAAMAISAFIPWAITPLLMVGGAFLCFEGAEKLAHKWLHSAEEDKAHHEQHLQAVVDEKVDMVAFEQDKIKGAVRTDFILSAEIIAISLGTVADKGLMEQFLVLLTIAIVMTVGVYGFVAGIVKIDDAGLHLAQRKGEGLLTAMMRGLGGALLQGAPWLMRGLSVAGTVAMFMVGGGILAHGTPGMHDIVHHLAEMAGTLAVVGGALSALVSPLFDGVLGVIAGAIIVVLVTLAKKLKPAAA